MSSSIDSSAERIELLQRLQQTPEVLDAVAACSDAERRSQKTLRDRFDPDLVRAALTLFDARCRAAGRIPEAQQLWLTPVGLEQSTAPQVAQHKAKRFRNLDAVLDLCCGIGIDASALSQVTTVDAYDADPAMALRCQWNAEVLGIPTQLRTHTADVSSQHWSGHYLHADPDRRSGGGRPTRRLEHYQPSLEWMQQLTTTAAGGAIKIGPASNFQQKFPGCEIELISWQGECREATVWFGELAGDHAFRATCLDTNESVSADPLSAWAEQAQEISQWLLDPNPAIVRAGLLDVLAESFQLQRLDPEEEYLTAEQLPDTGFVTGFQVEAVLSANPRDLRRYFSARPAAEYEIRCRRIPMDAETLRRRLPAGDGPPAVIVACRIGGRSRLVIARRPAA